MPSLPFPAGDSRIWTSTTASHMAGQDLSPVFTFYLRHIHRRPPHARWWSCCLTARLPSAPLFTYLLSFRANSRCARHCTMVNMVNWSDKSEKIYAKVQRWFPYIKQYSCVLSCLRATSTPSALSVWWIYLSPVFSLILELCLPFLKLCRLESLYSVSAKHFWRIWNIRGNSGSWTISDEAITTVSDLKVSVYPLCVVFLVSTASLHRRSTTTINVFHSCLQSC